MSIPQPELPTTGEPLATRGHWSRSVQHLERSSPVTSFRPMTELGETRRIGPTTWGAFALTRSRCRFFIAASCAAQ